MMRPFRTPCMFVFTSSRLNRLKMTWNSSTPMTLPPIPESPEDARPWFQRLQKLRQGWLAAGAPAEMLREVSMGMSGDFEVAVEEGATIVRVGTAIFGSRRP